MRPGRRAARALSIWARLAALSHFWLAGLHLIQKGWANFQVSTLAARANEFLLGPALLPMIPLEEYRAFTRSVSK